MLYKSYSREYCFINKTICYLLILLCRSIMAQENTVAENITERNDGVTSLFNCGFATLPPQPDISIKQVESEKIRIYWSIPKGKILPNPSNITFLVQNSGSAVELARLARYVSDACLVHRCHEDLVVPGMFAGAYYFIRAMYSFFNTSRCHSDIAEVHYHAQEIKESQIVFQVMVSLIFITIFLSLLWFLWKHRMCCRSSYRKTRAIHTHLTKINGAQENSILSVPMEYNNLYINNEDQERSTADKYEINYNQLQFEQQIGKGEFGQVFKARISATADILTINTVAVKTLEKNAINEEYEEFLREIAILKQIGQHPNIVTLIGCCTLRKPFCIVMEYIPCGDLLKYLRTLRLYLEKSDNSTSKDFRTESSYGRAKKILSDILQLSPSIPLNRLPSIHKVEYTALENLKRLDCAFEAKDLQHFAIQIARGMRYLENKQIVHRDLAARNILIDETKTLKISDFGLSRRGIYVNSKHQKVPLRWLSVEAIRDNLYTSKSDVWAYGIVLWEIGTLGGFPYPNIEDSTLVEFLWKGNRLEKPENCTYELYSLMQRCWLPTLDERPSFSTILEELESMSRERHIYVDFSQLNPSYMFPPLTQSIEE